MPRSPRAKQVATVTIRRQGDQLSTSANIHLGMILRKLPLSLGIAYGPSEVGPVKFVDEHIGDFISYLKSETPPWEKVAILLQSSVEQAKQIFFELGSFPKSIDPEAALNAMWKVVRTATLASFGEGWEMTLRRLFKSGGKLTFDEKGAVRCKFGDGASMTLVSTKDARRIGDDLWSAFVEALSIIRSGVPDSPSYTTGMQARSSRFKVLGPKSH